MKALLRFIAFIVATFICTRPLLANTSKLIGGMKVIEINRYQLVGAEYWPFYGNEPFRYPNDVLWGFYPEGASKNAIKCAEQSYNALLGFLRENWRLMRDVVGYGATRKFYLWTNDYSAALNDRVLRSARMWHSNSGTRDYNQGYWKWESTLRPNGTCEIPNSDQITGELAEAIKALSR